MSSRALRSDRTGFFFVAIFLGTLGACTDRHYVGEVNDGLNSVDGGATDGSIVDVVFAVPEDGTPVDARFFYEDLVSMPDGVGAGLLPLGAGCCSVGSGAFTQACFAAHGQPDPSGSTGYVVDSTNSSTALALNDPQCGSRTCLLMSSDDPNVAARRPAECTSACASESDCPVGFLCAVPLTVGSLCCQRFCIRESYLPVDPSTGGLIVVPSQCMPSVENNAACPNVPSSWSQIGGACAADSDCPTNAACDDTGVCVVDSFPAGSQATGAECFEDADCISGQCDDATDTCN